MTLSQFIADKNVLTDKTEMYNYLAQLGVEDNWGKDEIKALHTYWKDAYFIVELNEPMPGTESDYFTAPIGNHEPSGTLQFCEEKLWEYAYDED